MGCPKCLLLLLIALFAAGSDCYSTGDRSGVKCYGGTFCSGAQIEWWHWALIAVFSLGLLGLCLRECCRRLSLAHADVTCYLCGQENLPRSGWADHRTRCGHVMRKRIAAMPTSVVAGCPGCRRPLKMMSMDLEHDFSCNNGPRCLSLTLKRPPPQGNQGCNLSSGKRRMANLGDNRFNCFYCDYDMCRRCHDYLAISRFPGYGHKY